MKRKSKLLSRADLVALPDDTPLRESEAAVIMGVTCRTLARHRYLGGGAPYIRQGPRLVRYRKGSLLTWLAENEFTDTTSEGFRRPQKKPAEAQAGA